jgi:hypothetical protein
VDTTNGVGHVFSDFRIKVRDGPGTLSRAIANGEASGIARGFVRNQWGRIVASMGSEFSPNTGFSMGSLGGSTAGAGFIRSGRWCAPPHWPKS